MTDLLEIDGSTVTVDSETIDFDGAVAGTPSRVSQMAMLSVADTGPVASRASQFALLSVQSPAGIASDISQFAVIAVAANNRDYVRLENPYSLPCFNPCTSYGTFATIIRIGE